ncbi:Transcription elongation factor SPT4 [Lucilia cuprina]|nr:Transcription elongation factor SPT4 [Lucilia cuprina]
MSFDTIPKDLRGLRACLVCSLVKSFDQFEYDGCDNCDEFLRMKNNKDNVYDHTSSFSRGVYAISVSGNLPQATLREMKSRGIPYRPRDTSQR